MGRSSPNTPAADATFFVQAGDLNGDGFGDVLRLDASDELTPFGIWTPTPLFGGPTGFTAGSATTSAMPYGPIYSAGPAGDIDANGYADFLFKTRFTPVTYMGGAGGLTEGPSAATDGSQSFYAFGADYDGDGFADAASMTNNVSTILVTRGGPAGFDPAGFTTLTPPVPPSIGNFATIDGNGDGYANLAVGTDAGGAQSWPARPAGSARRQSRRSARRVGSSGQSRPATSTATGFRISSRRRGRGPSPSSSTTGRRAASRGPARRCRSPRRRRCAPTQSPTSTATASRT